MECWSDEYEINTEPLHDSGIPPIRQFSNSFSLISEYDPTNTALMHHET